MENFLLNNISSLVTISAFIIAPIIFICKRQSTKKTTRKEISKSLHRELTDALHAIDGTSGRQIMEIKIGDTKKYYTLTFMNYDMYDSLIFSGQIQFLNHDLQQKIQDIFRLIKSHKEYLQEIFHLENTGNIQDKDVTNLTNPYYEHIANSELELQKRIPLALKKLKKNF